MTSGPPSQREHDSERRPPSNAFGWLITPVFLLLALVFWLTSGTSQIPVAPTPTFDASQLDTSPRRVALTDPPVVEIAGFEQRCNACHKIFESTWDGSRPLLQHTHVELHHGINDSCFNCHDVEDRERLVLHDGSTVGYSQVENLCAQCHGPVFRDWQRGAHGKTLGSWNITSADARRLTCSECHDPHSPAYELYEPLPGPNTLRMGEQQPKSHHDEPTNNPLRRHQNSSSHGEGH
ncbi:MAG: hypothetical protein ACF8GE_05040 [Phycisphaerales bacterium JB043]